MIQPENVDALMDELISYCVTREKYDYFGYTYSSIKDAGKTAIVTYQGRIVHELHGRDAACLRFSG